MLVIGSIAGISHAFLKFAAHHKPKEVKSTEPVPTSPFQPFEQPPLPARPVSL